MLKRRTGSQPAQTGWLAKMILVQIALAPVIMTPALVAQERGKRVAELLSEPLLVAWIAVVTLAPVAVGGMVAFARSLQYEQSQLRAGSTQQKTRLKQENAALSQQLSQLHSELEQLKASFDLAQSQHNPGLAAGGEPASQLEAGTEPAQPQHKPGLTAGGEPVSQLEAGTEPAQSQYECKYGCGEAFETVQARNSHYQWCPNNPNGRRYQPRPNSNGSLQAEKAN
jgi:hypothetical protein